MKLPEFIESNAKDSVVRFFLLGRPCSEGTHNCVVHGQKENEHAFPYVPVFHSHVISRIGFKPLLVGAMHGLAGSATLTLLVLTQIQSVSLGLLYLALFGIGSTFGMLLMSGLIGLPFALSARAPLRLQLRIANNRGRIEHSFRTLVCV